MTAILRLFGFPPPERRDSVRFHFAKNLPYNTRINLALVLLVAGFALQIYFMKAFYGAPLLFVGICLVLVKGYDSRMRIKGFTQDPKWKTVSIEKIQEIEQLRKKNIKWDRDALDISSWVGVLSLILIGSVALAGASILGHLAKDTRVTTILAIDIAILMIPLWFSGMRLIMKQPNLAIKVRMILWLHKLFQDLKRKDEEFRPALMLSRGKKDKTIPADARFSIALPDSPEGFYGLQAQINLNVVQGTSYPYFYCVLAAKPGFGLSKFKKKIQLAKRVICEYQEDKQAEVLVIRQFTTRKSGYHTKERQCVGILTSALEAARLIRGQDTFSLNS
jgi:hypothetical protein